MDKSENVLNVELEKPPSLDSSDSVAREAVGGDSVDDLPKHYYRSPRFIGSFIVR